MPIYLEWDGGSIKGDVAETSHAQWIEFDSLQWGVGRSISMTTGSAADQSPSVPSFSEIVLTKACDNTSPQLITKLYKGGGVGTKIDLVRTNPDGTFATYLEFTLQNCMLSGYSCSSGGDAPSESWTLSYTNVEYKYTPTNPDGTMGDPVPVGYDLPTTTIS